MEKSEDRVTKWLYCRIRSMRSSLQETVCHENFMERADLRKSVFEKNNLGAMDQRVWGKRGQRWNM